MIKHTKERSLPATAGSIKESAQAGVISYRTLSLVVILVAALTLFLRFGWNWQDDALVANASGNADSRTPLTRDASDLDDHRGIRPRSLPAEKPVIAATEQPGADSDAALLPALAQLDEALGRAGAREQQTAAALKSFAASGEMAELRAIDRQDVVALADYLSDELSPAESGALLQEFLGLSPRAVQTPEEASATVVDVFDAVAGNRAGEVRPSVLMVTDGADGDGRITGQAHVLPTGTERIYAVFENAHSLAGLDQVLAVWRNPSDDRMVFTEFEPIRQGSAYNYVWLEVESGWPEGRYQVELFHPEAQSLLLASETFSVR